MIWILVLALFALGLGLFAWALSNFLDLLTDL